MAFSHKKLRWYFYRLTAMSSAEILHRLKEAIKRKSDRHYARPPASNDYGRLPQLPGMRESLSAWDAPKALLAQWQETLSTMQTREFFLLGQAWPQGERSKQWHLDPVTLKTWPSHLFCFDIDFRHEDGWGDVKYVWELNRLQYIQPIAALAFKRNDQTLMKTCLEEIENWIDNNPPYQGINWSSGIELALRAVSVLVACTLAGDHATTEQQKKIWQFLEASAHWIERYPSLYSSANNHLVAEGLGLFVIATLCPQFPRAACWRNKGWSILCDAARKQIFPDGVGAEQAISYTAVVLEMLLLGLHLARIGNIPIPDYYEQRLVAGGQYLRWFTDSAGNQPHIGDDDNARVFGVYRRNETYIRSVLGCLASMLHHAELIPPSLEPHFRQAIFGFAPEPTSSPYGIKHFPQGGYSVGRHKTGNHEYMIAFDHGDLGYLSIAAHGHADALAIWLHVDGQPVLIDSGTYLYHSGGIWREYFRGTTAHNTLSIDNQNSSVTSGNFNWSHKAKAWLEAYEHGHEQWWTLAAHDGYEKIFGTKHYRRLRVTPNKGFDIDDMLTGKKPHQVNIGFLLHPSLKTEQQDNYGIKILKDSATILTLSWDTPLACSTDIPGEKGCGWYSSTFGEKIPASRISFSGILEPKQVSTVRFAFPQS